MNTLVLIRNMMVIRNGLLVQMSAKNMFFVKKLKIYIYGYLSYCANAIYHIHPKYFALSI